MRLALLAGLARVLAAGTVSAQIPVPTACQNDIGGDDDAPGQKDLTKLCLGSGTGFDLVTKWNWDEISLNGNNTGDGCSLYDTDQPRDGTANIAVCSRWGGESQQVNGVELFTCGNNRADRCTNPVLVTPTNPTTTCQISRVSDDPFPGGDPDGSSDPQNPQDTQSLCGVKLSDFGTMATNAALINVCSYPSGQVNSAPSDCVLFTGPCDDDLDCADTNPCTIDECAAIPNTNLMECRNTPGNAGTACRPSAGVCDVADVCDGTSPICPSDGKSTAQCRASAGDCDPAEFCDGSGNTCPGDAKSTALCRASAGDCDPAESCDGSGNTCPGDAKSTSQCRASAGDCDPAESCDGSGNTCPGDAKSTSQCRPSAGNCDVPESCDGSSNDCPGDSFKPSTTICNPGSGDICDPDEYCTGDGPGCPDDVVKGSDFVCRESNGSVCDPAEKCTGVASQKCPTDAFADSSTSCEDEDDILCTKDLCDGLGVCKSTADDTRCVDPNACTADSCNPNDPDANADGCVFDPIPVQPNPTAASDSRAYGLSVELGGNGIIAPTPDSNVTNPDTLLAIPVPGVADVQVLDVEESADVATDPIGGDPTGATSSATAKTAEVNLIDQGTPPLSDWLVTAKAVHAVANCSADADTASSNLEGSVIEGLRIGDQNFDTITEPTEIEVTLPIGKATVKLLEKNPSGAAAGEVQPALGVNESDLTVNGIHVLVTDPDGNPLIDVVVAHAECSASFKQVCEVSPHVSGEGFVVGLEVDETAIDPDNVLLHTKVASVKLPSTGGSDDATLKHVGPIANDQPTTTLVEADAAFSHTEGTVDKNGNTASSTTESEVANLILLDTGTDPTNPLVLADVVRADCQSAANGSGGASSGSTTLVGLSIGGTDVCASLMREDTCTPPPNTDIPGSPNGTLIRVNEQIDTSSAGETGITVNAIHLFIVGEENPFGLPFGADIIISSAHCDAAASPGS